MVSPSQPPGDPEDIPHDDEERGAATTSNPEPKPQVSGHVRPEPQVTDSARTTLSRWRHGFEPRWDYSRKRAGHGLSAGDARHEPGVSTPTDPANIPRQVRLCVSALVPSMPDRSRQFPLLLVRVLVWAFKSHVACPVWRHTPAIRMNRQKSNELTPRSPGNIRVSAEAGQDQSDAPQVTENLSITR